RSPAAPSPAALPGREPVFLLYAMVNRPYVLDLAPGHSLIEFLTRSGRDVFLLDWGNPGPREAERSIESYLRDTVHPAIRRALAETGAPRVTLLGYCQGGTYAALYAALHPETVARLIIMAAPLDFGRCDLLTVWSRMPGFDGDLLRDGSGNVNGLALRWGFELMRPFETPVRYLRFFERMNQPETGVSDDELEHFMAMEHWVNDVVDHPGRAFREFHRWFYRENLLMNGGVRLGDDLARLEEIACRTLLLVGRKDHLVPAASTLAAAERLPRRLTTTLETDCGHIGLSVSGRALRDVWPQVLTWMETR
ncbi:MAG: alpha/beta fold hydrolase, partial [Planctomycetes bacterium]|nr:alpha/beta fold hydrolase [Planctomycetota bacterium]